MNFPTTLCYTPISASDSDAEVESEEEEDPYPLEGKFKDQDDYDQYVCIFVPAQRIHTLPVLCPCPK